MAQIAQKTVCIQVGARTELEGRAAPARGRALTAGPSFLRGASVELKRTRSYAKSSRSTVRTEAVAAPERAATDRAFNFSAGPACLPLDVLEQAQADLINWQGSGMSVMEMSHRGKSFLSIYNEAQADLRKLLEVPDNYKILFLQGGASTQFAALPLNLTKAEDTVDFITTGSWGTKAYKEAQKFVNANEAANGKAYAGKFTDIPPQSEWKLTPGAKYVHICANETIQGVEFKYTPEGLEAPLVADMSSNFLSKPIDVSKYGVIYAGAQKNVGPAGCVIAIVRDDLLGNARPECPTMLDYQTAADNDSMYNTPPCFAIYMCGLVFKKLLAMGGLAEVEKYNKAKAAVIYDAIADSNGFYDCPNAAGVRSCMNVPFTIPSNAALEGEFIKMAAERGMTDLKGHRSVGGVRASIYNAMSMEGVGALAAFMKEFQAMAPELEKTLG